MSNGEPGCHYFEQLCYNDMWLKVGDCVFIKSHGLVRPRVGRWVQLLYLLFVSIKMTWVSDGLVTKSIKESGGKKILLNEVKCYKLLLGCSRGLAT